MEKGVKKRKKKAFTKLNNIFISKVQREQAAPWNDVHVELQQPNVIQPKQHFNDFSVILQ